MLMDATFENAKMVLVYAIGDCNSLPEDGNARLSTPTHVPSATCLSKGRACNAAFEKDARGLLSKMTRVF